MNRPRLPRLFSPLVVLGLSLLLTGAATLFVSISTRERDQARFENAVEATLDRINTRLQLYIALLRGGGGLFATDPNVQLAEFRAYVDRLNLETNYPGAQGIGYSARVVAAEVDSVVDAMRAAGVQEFHIWPTLDPEPHSIVYLEPLDARNQATLGFNMFSEPTRRAAMQRARDTSLPAMTGRVLLKQEIGPEQQPGFLIYVPVYRGGNIPPTVAGRRELLRGFVYSPFRAGDLFEGIFGTEGSPRVAFRVYDGPTVEPGALLYDSRANSGASAKKPRFTQTVQREIAGRTWTVAVSSLPRWENTLGGWLVPGTLLAGLLAALVLFGLARAQQEAYREAEQRAVQNNELAERLQEQTVELEERIDQSRALNEELLATNEELSATTELAESARAAADEANQAKSDFLATMSHELRTPLNAIGGYTELLEMGIRGPVTAQQLSDLDRIRRSQQHLLGLINDILHFAKLEAGRVEFVMADVPVREVTQALRAMTEPQLRARPLSYSFDVSCDAGLAVRGEADKIQQVLLNLVGNAAKFTPIGGRVEVCCETDAQSVRLRVRDTGIGIPADKLDAIFNPFVQVGRHKMEESQQGVGLGLAISRDLARGMNGDLTVESVVGEGSTFTLSLPRADDAAGATGNQGTG